MTRSSTSPALLAFPLPWFGTLCVTGSDRQSWLNGLLTCDLKGLSVGAGTYGLATSKVGRILADVVVVATSDTLLLGVPRARDHVLLTEFDRYLVMEDAAVSGESDRFAWVALVGAGAAAVAQQLAPGVVAAPLALLEGQDGAVIVTPVTAFETLCAALVHAGAELSDEASWDRLRLEAGAPRFGVDFDEKTYPQEANLERRAVSFQKGCYLGQEVVCRLEMRGHVRRRLASLEIEGEETLAPGVEVTTLAGESVGAVTSAAWSPTCGVVALAMLTRAYTEPGQALLAGRSAARVVATPHHKG